MTKKEKLSIKAREFQKYLHDNFNEEITNSVDNTKIYTECNIEAEYNSIINIEVVDLDTVGAVVENGNCGKLCALNFASFKNPGGGYLNGAMAQEEAICGESTLYPVLCEFDDKFYKYNRNNMNNGMYMNRALYSKDILFNTGSIKVDVITCASPNLSSALTNNNKQVLNNNSKVLESRIKFVLEIALENKVETLILGAFGCGVFKQEALEVAKIFKRLLVNGDKMLSFKKVVFAIPTFNEKSASNYNDFKSVFK